MTDQVAISLDAAHLKLARDEAARHGVPLDVYLSRLVQGNLPTPTTAVVDKPTISSIFGIGASAELTDIGRDKRRMVGDAVASEHLRKTRQAS